MASKGLSRKELMHLFRMSELEGQVGLLLPLVKQLHIDALSIRKKRLPRDLIVLKEGSVITWKGRLIYLGGKVDRLEEKFDRLETLVTSLHHKVDALPRVLAEMLDDRATKRKS